MTNPEETQEEVTDMSKVLSRASVSLVQKQVIPDRDLEEAARAVVGDITDDEERHMQAVTSRKTVELPDLVARAQGQVRDHLKSAESDVATYSDRIELLDAEIQKSENDKQQAEDQVRYWQDVQENTVKVISVLKQRRAGPQAALDALRKSGLQ